MKKNALRKDFFVEIKKTYSRFISIFFIVALGVAFFSGIRSAEPDMRISADKYYDQSALMDIKIIGTLGITDDDVAVIENLDGIEFSKGAYTADVLCENGNNYDVVKVLSYSDEVNKIDVKEGRVPENQNECIVDTMFLEKSKYKIGDTITIKSGTDDLIEDTFAEDTFTITGTCTSSEYMALTRGTSSIGTGEIKSFIVVPENAFSLDVYTEMYVRVKGADKLMAYSDEYIELIEEKVELIEDTVSEQRITARYTQVLGDAEEELSDAQNTLDEEEQKANKELADAKKKLDDADEELLDAKKKLDDGEKELADGKAELADKEKEIVDAQKEIDTNQKKINDGKVELEKNRKDLLAGIKTFEKEEEKFKKAERKVKDSDKEIRQGKAQLKDAKAKLKSSKAEYNAGKTQYENGLVEYNKGVSELLKGKEELEKAKLQLNYITDPNMLEATKAEIAKQEGIISASESQLNQVKVTLEATKGKLNAASKQIIDGESEINDNEEKLIAAEKQLEKGKAEIEKARVEIEAARKKFSVGEAEIKKAEKELLDGNAELAKARKEIADGKVKIADAKVTIADSQKELLDGRTKYEDGKKEVEDAKKEYEDAKLDAETQIADARAKIHDAEKEIKKIKKPKWYVFDRTSIRTYSEYNEDADRIAAIGRVFPVIFFIVAAMVSLTTMTRMVEEQRTQIGTLKALGYGKLSIAGKYILYALLATFGGSVLGGIVGGFYLPYVIIHAYQIMYAGLGVIETPLNWYYITFATVLAVSCVTLATVMACYKELQESAAQLMRPAAPKQGKRVLLEKIPFVWTRLSFIWKSTVRNLLRYKKRFFMTLFGISGCMALLIVGFGIKDSIFAIVELQFGQVSKYDSILVIDEDATPEETKALTDFLDNKDKISGYQYVMQKSMDVSKDDNERAAMLTVFEDPNEIDSYVELRNRKSHEKYSLTDDTVIISEKLAKILEVKVGDLICLKDDKLEMKEVRVSAITENYVQHYVYMTPSLYKNLYEDIPVSNAIYTKNVSIETEFETALSEEILKHEAVISANFMGSAKEQFDNMLSSLDTVVAILIVSAGGLAFVVLYNLNNINITERIRELATIKVLGFYDLEVSEYVFRENILLTLIGTAIGVLFGTALHRFIITTVEVDMTMFSRKITLISYAMSVVITFVFAALINCTMHFKLKKIDMASSLKSIE